MLLTPRTVLFAGRRAGLAGTRTLLPSFHLSHNNNSWKQKLSTATSTTTTAFSVKDNGVATLELQRPAMDLKFWDEFARAVQVLSGDSKVRCVLLASTGKVFSFGLDVKDKKQVEVLTGKELDPARKSEVLRRFVGRLQDSFTALERAPPVIACVHSYCIGGAMDLICAADIRYATKDASFSIKEVDVGLCPDLGTLQRIERIVKSSSLVRELAFTGRQMGAEEALACGFVSRVFDTREEMMSAAAALAETIARKSPIAVSGIKENLNYSRGRPVEESLKYQATWSACALQAVDVEKGLATAAAGGKGAPLEFANLPKQ